MRTIFFAALSMLACTSCVVEEIVAATVEGFLEAPPDGATHALPDGGSPSPPAEGGHPAHPCTATEQCHPDEFCSKATCQDPQGTCMRAPIICGGIADPFCGCNGITYFNDCLRKTYGVPASTQGECNATALTCGNPMDPPCPAPSVCARLLPQGGPRCPHDVPGSCWVVPAVCDAPASGDSWMPCGPPAPCVDTCRAIQTGVPHWRAPGCPI